jgi:hypothetical protein
MSVVEKISKLVKSQFPDFYHEEGERFIAFVEAYYEYLEQTGKVNNELRSLQSYRDIATTTDEFIKYFINSFLPSVPLDVAADKKLMIKYIKNFNQARGTVGSYKLLFRAIFNEDLEISFPADRIIKVSDGDWRKERYLITNYDRRIYTFIAKTIVGMSSGAQALVEDIVRKNIRGRDVMQILLSNIKGTFVNLERIKLLNETSQILPTIEAGIAGIQIITSGGNFVPGDVLDLQSELNGQFGKAVVTETTDLLGSLSYNIVDGGSGYTASIDDGGTVIEFTGGDGDEEGSFQIRKDDINDTFAIAINVNLIASNTLFGEVAPSVLEANGSLLKASTFANVIISAADYGFPEEAEETTSGVDYRDHKNAVLRIANTKNIPSNSSLFGLASSANCRVLEVINGTAGNTYVRIDGYRNFTGSETVRLNFANNLGSNVGTVATFFGNTIGYHVLEIANVNGVAISEGDEVVGLVSNSYGVVKKILLNSNAAYTNAENPSDIRNVVTVRVTANNAANLTNQFTTGPLKPYIQNEPLRFQGSNTFIGNTTNDTANSEIENIYGRLIDAFTFEAVTFGTIAKLSFINSGAGYSVAPRIRVRENDIAALGIGEAYVTIQSNDVNWGTGNSTFTVLDTNDRLFQATTGASADVKGTPTGVPLTVTSYANGTYEMTVRVWQPPLQREPGNITFENNANVTLQIFNSSYVFGNTDTRTIADTGTAKIVRIVDRGVLGDNARITASVGANGAITGIRVLDSGFCYNDKEIVLVENTRPNATGSALRLTLNSVGNSEGYYATTRSHISSTRGVLQDSKYFQEYSYEIISPISLDRYRDIVLKLVHGAGQALFGKFRTQSNAYLDIVATSDNKIRRKATGTIAINNGSRNITGTGTTFLSQFANSDLIVIEYAHEQYYKIPINIVSSNTAANLTIAWANTNLSGANAYYFV